MINIFCEYIKYQLNAKRRYGIHSPFIYNFGDKCLKTLVSKNDLQIFRQLKSSFLKNQTTVSINDSSRNDNQVYSIRSFTKKFGISEKTGKLIYRIISHYKINNVLELGTGTGLGTYMLSAGNKEAKIITTENNQAFFSLAKTNFPSALKNNVKFINDSFLHYLKSKENLPVFDFVLINGNQWNISSVKESLVLLKPLIHDETFIFINGIRQRKEMFKFWQETTIDPDYHLSIDLFRVGILLKRHHQHKEHFVIR